MDKNKPKPIIIGAVVVLLAGAVVLAQSAAFSSDSTPPPAPVTDTGATYTMADVAMHNSGSSCWTAINGSVYDVTSFIGQHPGGEQAILSLCGIDGSSAFNAQHGGQSRPASELASFKIGTLSQ